MKTLKPQMALIMLLSFMFINESNAQMIVNNTNCQYRVKANYVPSPNCMFNGGGPLVMIAPNATMALSPPLPGDWIPGFGVNLIGLPPRVVTDATCPGPITRNIGFCAGAIATAAYVAGGDLHIN